MQRLAPARKRQASLRLLLLAAAACGTALCAHAAEKRRDTTERSPWQYIVVHHSASPSGNLAAFSRQHRSKGWDSEAYHFVIDNGKGGPDGHLEVGQRWWMQKHGAHAGRLPSGAHKDVRNGYNEFGIGICLVGNFEHREPTSAQLSTLADLIGRLQEECGIPEENIVGHRHVKSTACPGGLFPWSRLFAKLNLSAGSLHRRRSMTTTERCTWCYEREAMSGTGSRRSAGARIDPREMPPPVLLKRNW